MERKSFITIFTLLIFLCNPVSAITYSGASPSNGSTIGSTEVPFSIDYINVCDVDVNTGILSIEVGSSYTNYTVEQTSNTSANITKELSSNVEYNYKWFVNDSCTGSTNYTVSGIYTFKVGMFAGISDILISIPTMIPAMMQIVVWVSIIGIVILIVGIIKGWFNKGGLFANMLKGVGKK